MLFSYFIPTIFYIYLVYKEGQKMLARNLIRISSKLHKGKRYGMLENGNREEIIRFLSLFY